VGARGWTVANQQFVANRLCTTVERQITFIHQNRSPLVPDGTPNPGGFPSGANLPKPTFAPGTHVACRDTSSGRVGSEQLIEQNMAIRIIARIRARPEGAVDMRRLPFAFCVSGGVRCSQTLTKLLAFRSPVKLEFEWHDVNAEASLQADGVSLEWRRQCSRIRLPSSGSTTVRTRAKSVFVVIGEAEGYVLLFVAYTERQGRIRLISARRVTQHEQDDYSDKML
jgi:uncharacterized DUF497 family protein